MKVDDFDYELPPELIAQEAAEPRDAARMLRWCAERGREHLHVRDLPGELRAGDLLVVNDTRVRPARLFARRSSGGRVELVVLEPARDLAGEPAKQGASWLSLARPARKLKPGEWLQVDGAPEGSPRVQLEERLEQADGPPLWRVAAEEGGLDELLEAFGRMPLPPYVERSAEGDERDGRDRDRYQTIFASESGAVAAPTAGLHFTPGLLAQLAERGVELAQVTLHVGMGTFRPVTAEDTSEHVMHHERYVLGEETAAAVAACRARGGRVIAVGTTSVRTLESCADGEGRLAPGSGSTNLFITPGYRFRVVDGLLTNFHLPRSTLLMLVSALVGREEALALYAEAVREGYRFYNYGDACLFLPRS